MSSNKYESAYNEVLNYFRRNLPSHRVIETLCDSPGFQHYHPNPILVDLVLNKHLGSLAGSKNRNQHLLTEKYFKHRRWTLYARTAATAASLFAPGSNFAFAALHSRSAKSSNRHIGNLQGAQRTRLHDTFFQNHIASVLRVKKAKLAGRSAKVGFNIAVL